METKMSSNEAANGDESFVELFKKEHNEQFHVLVKMHLSFLLHMTTEESECFYEKVKLRKWNLVPFGKKSKHRNVSEGATLNQEALNQLHQLIAFIKKDENIKSEGIFRRTGSLERQNDLKTALYQGQTIDFKENSFTVHDCASVLKGFLADLPEPLTTDIQFPVYCQIAESFKINEPSHEVKILQSVQLLFLLLPKENKQMLQDIFELLHQVALYEKENKMSPENLAKLFTPHLLCPRKLAPETLLKDSQTLFGTVAFMIKKFPELFNIPAQLLLDFRSHYEQANVLNESVKGAAHTVFTFVDNKLTAKENEQNVTETALAQLYAHIQSLPESSKKRKLVKQFNKENGQGTPLQVIRSSVPKNKSFGDSIKKHMFHKKLLKNVKKSSYSQLKTASSDEVLNSPHSSQKNPRGRLFCHNFDSSSDDEDKPPKRPKRSQDTPVNCRRKSDSDLTLGDVSGTPGQYLTSTPACRPLLNGNDVFTPEGQNRKSMSPITRSTQRMPRAMQETMMTPRSRKPVLLVSGTNINNLAKVSPKLTLLQEEAQLKLNKESEVEGSDRYGRSEEMLVEESSEKGVKRTHTITDLTPDYSKKSFVKSKSDGDLTINQKNTEKQPKMNKTDSPKTLSDTFQQYLSSRDMLTCSPTDSSFSSRSDDFQSYSELHNECSSSFKNNDNDTEGDKEDFLADFCDDKMTNSMLYILNGNEPDDGSFSNSVGEKKLVLKPRQFDENGKPIVFETSF